MRFIAGLIVGLLLVAAALAFVAYGGRFAVAASTPPDIVDRLAPTARDRAIARAAPTMNLPADDKAAARGMEHYRENCLPCHGAPGVKPAEFAEGMNPRPPLLDSGHTQAFSDGELFWIVKNGIRASGMPGFGVNHKDEEVQHIVAFVRHVPKLTEAQRQGLAQAVAAEDHHHEAATAGAEHEHGPAPPEHHH